MILRTIATVILWGLLGIIVYGLKEPGAMWILNLCATLTLFEVYTILGRIGFAANRTRHPAPKSRDHRLHTILPQVQTSTPSNFRENSCYLTIPARYQ